MSIVLLEPSDPSKTWKCSSELVSMKHTKISKSNWQISVRSLDHIEHHTMSRTIHRLEPMLFFSILNEEYVLFILKVVTTHFPEFWVIHVRRNDFAVASNFVFGSHEFDESVVDYSTVRVKQCWAGSKVCKVKQFILRTNCSMVSLKQFLLLLEILVKLTLFWESNSVNSLQIIVIFVSQPVSRRVFSNFDSLNPISWRKVRTCAQINQITTSIGRCQSIFRYFVFYQLKFERVVGKHLECLSLCQQNSFIGLFLLSISFDFLLNLFIVLLWYFCFSDKGIIEKAIIKRWTMTEPGSIEVFQTLPE